MALASKPRRPKPPLRLTLTNRGQLSSAAHMRSRLTKYRGAQRILNGRLDVLLTLWPKAYHVHGGTAADRRGELLPCCLLMFSVTAAVYDV